MNELGTIADETQLLQEFLRERDIQCPRCSYNLRNLVGNRCPECGDELALKVNLTEPRQGAMIAGLIGLAAGLGFNGLILIYVAIMSVFYRSWPPGRFMWVIGGGTAVFGLALLAWMLKWKAIRKQPQQKQVWLAITCWILVLAHLIIFVKSSR